MSTASLRRDHELIERVCKSMDATVSLLEGAKKVPDVILLPVIDFTKNFTDVCHHGKEEGSLFPALEKSGMPSNMGPIAMMLMDHEKSRQIAQRMEDAAQQYLAGNSPDPLISSMREYVTHVREHLWKENNRLFMMAEARLQHVASKVNDELEEIESEKLKQLGRSRQHYEELTGNLERKISDVV